MASCCSCNDQDGGSAGGNWGFNCSQVCVFPSRRHRQLPNPCLFFDFGWFEGRINHLCLACHMDFSKKCHFERDLHPVEKQTFMFLFSPPFWNRLAVYPFCKCISTHLLSIIHVKYALSSINCGHSGIWRWWCLMLCSFHSLYTGKLYDGPLYSERQRSLFP